MAVFDLVLESSGRDAEGPLKVDQAAGGAAAATAGKGDAAKAAPLECPELESALRKAGWRLIPLTMAIALCNHMDRSNLSYAALSFNRDNGFGGRTYATGVACFYASFMLCMLPSNLIMVRVGTRPWLGGLLVAWGAVAACFSLISSAASFYALRVLLGAFEAGAFPAMWYALGAFYPRSRITKPFAYLTIAIMLANTIGAPIAAGLLALDGVAGLKGWQWLFIVEGVPSAVLGLVVLAFLPTSPAAARFLTPAERAALAVEFARDAAPGPLGRDPRGALALLRMATRNGRLWVAFLAGALASLSSHTYLTYTPILINALLTGKALTNEVSVAAAAGAKSLLPVALAVVPYALASATSYFVAASAQRRNEHFIHVSACLALSGAALALFPVMAGASVAGGFASMILSISFGAAANGPATALVARLCQGPEQVVAMPLFSSFGVLGGVAGPLMAGAILNRLGGFTWLTVIMGVMLVLTSALVLALRFAVRATGGMPADSLRAAPRRGSDHDAAAAGGPPSPGGRSVASDASSGPAASGLCVVLPARGRGSGGSPKAAGGL